METVEEEVEGAEVVVILAEEEAVEVLLLYISWLYVSSL